jgi:hypothetical protein
MFVGESLDRLHYFVDGPARPHQWADGLEPAVEGVRVAVAERGHQEAAIEIHHVGVTSRRPGLIADRLDFPVGDQQRVGVAGRACPDDTTGEERRSHLRDPTPKPVCDTVI